ncbi:MAG: sigma-70 family RNA polymerase sigma factor [Planctomycetota bacterium]
MTHAPKTRQSLLIELARHSDEAWAEFVEVYEQAIFRYCRSMGLQEADARDATQDVLAALHKKLPTWELDDTSEGTFRAWLFRVARNVSIDAIAERARATAASGGSAAELALDQLADPAHGETGPGAFDAELRRSLLSWAAAQVQREVRDVTWRAFHLTAVQGRSAADAATELGVPVGSIYTAKCRVVARIRARVAQLSGEHQSTGAPRPSSNS